MNSYVQSVSVVFMSILFSVILRVDGHSVKRSRKHVPCCQRPRMVAEPVVAFTDPGSFRYSGAAASLLLDGGICSGIERQEDQLMYQQMVIDEAGAARTPVPQGKLADLRIGNKPETLAVDEKLYAELANVEANPFGELSLPGMTDVNGLKIWRRFLEEWEPVNRGRYRAMLMQLLQGPLRGSRGQALRSGNVLYGSARHRIWTRSVTQSKQQYWHTTQRIQSGAHMSD